MVSHPDLGSDQPIRSDRELGRDISSVSRGSMCWQNSMKKYVEII